MKVLFSEQHNISCYFCFTVDGLSGHASRERATSYLSIFDYICCVSHYNDIWCPHHWYSTCDLDRPIVPRTRPGTVLVLFVDESLRVVIIRGETQLSCHIAF